MCRRYRVLHTGFMPIGRYASRKLVLHDRTEPEEVRAAAERNNWTFAGQIDRDQENGVFHEVRWNTDDGGSVHYVIDEFADVLYLVVRHEDPAAAERLAATIESSLPVWTVDDLLEECYVQVYPAGWAKALLRLGVGAPLEETEPVLAHVRFSAGHRDAEVRRAAVWAMVYAEWPVYREILANLAETDEDQRVSREAALAVEQFDRTGSFRR